ncbi:MAG: LLM class flavin-dependent oxidoreductase [Nocardioides sp.]|uniref:LLM class flavin-dependent oxidoreductase n=1 Tax=Nocardioides sp. TaxID=35761 RepID=UPI0039E69928
MRFSVWPQGTLAPADILAEARWADRNGWRGIWLADHYMPNTGGADVASGPVQEVWAMLPAVAALTETLRVGTMVSPTSIHHPAILANRVSTIDNLSGGRITLGLGAGWQVNEHAAFGIPLEAPRERVDRFEDAIRIIRSMLAEDRTTYHGRVYDIRDAPCEPKPVQSPLPILVGSTSPRMLRITARYADQWNTWGDATEARRNRQALLDTADRVGRDPEEIWTTANVLLDLGDTGYDAGVGNQGPRPVVRGDAAEVVDALGAYVEAGFDELILPSWWFGDTTDQRLAVLDRIHADVVPALA